MTRVEVVLDRDRAELTVAERPIVTVATSLVEVFGKLRGRLPAALQHKVRTLSRSVDLAALLPLYTGGHALPDELVLGSAASGSARFDEDLERMRASPARVAEQIAIMFPHDVPHSLRPWVRRPQRSLDRYADALKAYHDIVIGALYPGLPERLHREAEVVRRAVDSDERARVLSRLHPGYTLTNDARLQYQTSLNTGNDVVRHTNQLLLVPMVSDPRTIFSNVYGRSAQPWIALSYFSPNLAVFSEQVRVPPVPDPLATLVGHSQARVLRQLHRAATTTDLANDLGLAPSTVSHHLHALLATDTVHAHRLGRAVYYRLTERGRQLLTLYGTSA